MAERVKYQTGNPSEAGVYAVRVEGMYGNLLRDSFLTWNDGRWCQPGSDQYHRGRVYGWIGPLERTRKP